MVDVSQLIIYISYAKWWGLNFFHKIKKFRHCKSLVEPNCVPKNHLYHWLYLQVRFEITTPNTIIRPIHICEVRFNTLYIVQHVSYESSSCLKNRSALIHRTTVFYKFLFVVVVILENIKPFKSYRSIFVFGIVAFGNSPPKSTISLLP